MITPEIFIGLESTNTRLFLNNIREIKPDVLDEVVCRHYQTTPDAIQCKCRKRELSEPRQISMALRQVVLGHSQHKAGLPFRKDHATALYAKRTVRSLYMTNKQYRQRIWDIVKELGVPVAWFHEEIQKDTRIYNVSQN